MELILFLPDFTINVFARWTFNGDFLSVFFDFLKIRANDEIRRNGKTFDIFLLLTMC